MVLDGTCELMMLRPLRARENGLALGRASGGQVSRIDFETDGDDRLPNTDPRLNMERLPHEFLETVFHYDAPLGAKS